MRMWMIDPKKMCRKHLLGEHVECHMLFGSLARGKSVAGFLSKRLLEPQKLKARHDALAEEMLRRGYNHASPIEQPESAPEGTVDVDESERELVRRCSACALRILTRTEEP